MTGHETCCALAEFFPLAYSRTMIEGLDVSGVLLPFHPFHRLERPEHQRDRFQPTVKMQDSELHVLASEFQC